MKLQSIDHIVIQVSSHDSILLQQILCQPFADMTIGTFIRKAIRKSECVRACADLDDIKKYLQCL